MRLHSLPNKNILDQLISISNKNPNHIIFIEKEKRITRKEFIEKILKVKGGLKTLVALAESNWVVAQNFFTLTEDMGSCFFDNNEMKSKK